MSKCRDNKHRRQRARRKLADYRSRQPQQRALVVPVEIVAVTGKLPIPVTPS